MSTVSIILISFAALGFAAIFIYVIAFILRFTERATPSPIAKVDYYKSNDYVIVMAKYPGIIKQQGKATEGLRIPSFNPKAYDRAIGCKHCDGSGFILETYNSSESCNVCDGSGEIVIPATE